MLRSLRVANHRSVRDEQELILVPAYRTEAPVVSVAAVFGANASGKSNLVDALRWMDRAVQSSYRSWEAESGVPRSPYRLDVAFADKPSEFVADLIIDGVQFVYGFAVTGDAVQEEWLHSYPHGRERVIFERRGRTVELGSTIAERRGRADVLSGLLRDNALLLSTAVQASQEEVLPVYRWFRDSLRILDSRRSWARTPAVVGERVLDAVQRHPELIDLLQAADLGVTGVEVVPTSAEILHARKIAGALAGAEPAQTEIVRTLLNDRRRGANLQQEVLFLHGEKRVPLGLEDQSDGTLAWADLLIAALSALEAGALLVIDEIDASLHPRLTVRLVELFRNRATNPDGAQLIFTTHDATLLGTNLGEEVLRRDEIWFVEKQDGASRLYPLSDFHPRKGENRERRYLAGSYGAVPAVFEDSLVESVLASRTESPDGPA